MQTTNVIKNPRFEGDKATKVQVVKTSQLAVDALYLKPGQQHGPHRLPTRDRAIAVIEGSVVVAVHRDVEERVDATAGEVVLAPRGVWHTILNTSGQNAVLLLSSQFPVQVEERG